MVVKVDNNPHLTTPTRHVMVGVTRSKVILVSHSLEVDLGEDSDSDILRMVPRLTKKCKTSMKCQFLHANCCAIFRFENKSEVKKGAFTFPAEDLLYVQYMLGHIPYLQFLQFCMFVACLYLFICPCLYTLVSPLPHPPVMLLLLLQEARKATNVAMCGRFCRITITMRRTGKTLLQMQRNASR